MAAQMGDPMRFKVGLAGLRGELALAAYSGPVGTEAGFLWSVSD